MKALKHKFNAAKVDDQFLCVTSNHAEIMDHSKLSALLRTTKRALTVIPLELLREKAEATT